VDDALAVTQHLHLDVADVREIALDVHGRIAERDVRLRHRFG
jgi:hypothetical protein